MEHQCETVIKHTLHDIEVKLYNKAKAETFCLAFYEDPEVHPEMPDRYYDFKLFKVVVTELSNPETGPMPSDLVEDLEEVKGFDVEGIQFPMEKDWDEENIAQFIFDAVEQYHG